MGWQNVFAAIFQAGNRIIINGNGFFIYNGTPAFGNLLAAFVPENYTDQYGNVVPFQGLQIWDPSAQSMMLINGESFATYFYLTEAGPYTNLINIFISSISSILGITGQLGMSVDLELPISQIFASEPGSPGTAETWHSITLPTSGTWAGTLRVKYLPLLNFAIIDANLTYTTTVTGTQYAAGALPSSSYYPSASRYGALAVNQAFTTTANAVPRIEVPTSGDVQLFMPAFNTAGNTSIVVGTFIYPLD